MIEVEAQYDGGMEEDERLASEGEAILAKIQQEGGRVGYDSADFVSERWEYDNCTHEFVAPKGYSRP